MDTIAHLDTRAQTTQDYAIGIGLFLVVVMFVLTFVPAVMAPFGDVADTERSAQAERAASSILASAATDGPDAHLSAEALRDTLDEHNLSTAVSLPDRVNINVTVQELDGDSTVVAGGDTYTDADAGTWTRIVTTDAEDECDPACRLTVRVW